MKCIPCFHDLNINNGKWIIHPNLWWYDKVHVFSHSWTIIEISRLILDTYLTQCTWQEFQKFNTFRNVCIMMMMKYCNAQTNAYDSQATFEDIWSHQKTITVITETKPSFLGIYTDSNVNTLGYICCTFVTKLSLCINEALGNNRYTPRCRQPWRELIALSIACTVC